MWIGLSFNASDKYISHKRGEFSDVKNWGQQVVSGNGAIDRVVLFEAKFQIKRTGAPTVFLDIDGTPVEGENKPVNETAIT